VEVYFYFFLEFRVLELKLETSIPDVLCPGLVYVSPTKSVTLMGIAKKSIFIFCKGFIDFFFEEPN